MQERMIVDLKEEVKFWKEQLVLKDNYLRDEIVSLSSKLHIALSNQVSNSDTLNLSQDSSSIEYKQDDTITDVYQQD